MIFFHKNIYECIGFYNDISKNVLVVPNYHFIWAACNVGDLGLIPELGRSPGEENGYPFQYSALENSMDCIVHGVEKSQTQLSDFHFHRDIHPPRKSRK